LIREQDPVYLVEAFLLANFAIAAGFSFQILLFLSREQVWVAIWCDGLRLADFVALQMSI
jgi:hypothetical protein